MSDFKNIINLNSYIRIESIKSDFQRDCEYISNESQIDKIDIFKIQNIIFENSQLRFLFYDSLKLKGIEHTVINCLSSDEIFEESMFNARGIIVFDNVCACKNNHILETITNYKNSKLLVC